MRQSASPPSSLPAWARLADAAATVLLLAAGAIVMFGGTKLRIASLRVSIVSPWRPALAAFVVIALRHLFVRRRPLHLRLVGPLVAAARRLCAVPGRRWATLGRTALYVAAVAAFVASVARYYDRTTGFTILIGFGEQFQSKVLPAVREVPHVTLAGSGYDGQFYAQLAVDPLLLDRRIDRVLDTAPYRARRILLAWTAWLIGLGRPRWILEVCALQNVVAWLLLAWLLLRWFEPSRTRNFLPWFGCLFGSGLIGSVQLSLPEGPSLLLLALAILAVERRRRWLAGGLMGLAGLARETNLFASGLLIDRLPRRGRDVVALVGPIALAGLPFLVWSLYVRSVYPAFKYSNPASFAFPFSAYVGAWKAALDELRALGWESYARYNLAVIIGLTTQAVFLLTRWEPRSAWWRVGIAYCLLMPMLSSALWSGYPGSAVRVLLPMTIAFNVLVVRSRWFWPLVILGNLSAWHGVQAIAFSPLPQAL